MKSPQERFNEKWELDANSGCWLWTGYTNIENGYGQFFLNGKNTQAHRAAWTLFVGPIPPDHDIDHVEAAGCLHRHCVNYTQHLEPVTHHVNLLRSSGFVAENARKTHCGTCSEPFDSENTYIDYLGRRNCRNCGRRRKAAERAARKKSSC